MVCKLILDSIDDIYEIIDEIITAIRDKKEE